jgi:hypothetical protein
MSKPISQREMIRRLRALGWEGPFPGKRHPVMRQGSRKLPIPNPHGRDIDWSLVERILAQFGISRDEWDRA